MAGLTVADAGTLVGGIEVAGVGAGCELVWRNSMAGAADATGAVAPLGRNKNWLAGRLTTGGSVRMAEAIGAGQIAAVERTLTGNAPEVGEIHPHLFLEVDVLVEIGDAVVVIVLGGVSVAFVAANGVSAPITQQRREMAGVTARVQIELIPMTASALNRLFSSQTGVLNSTWPVLGLPLLWQPRVAQVRLLRL